MDVPEREGNVPEEWIQNWWLKTGCVIGRDRFELEPDPVKSGRVQSKVNNYPRESG